MSTNTQHQVLTLHCDRSGHATHWAARVTSQDCSSRPDRPGTGLGGCRSGAGHSRWRAQSRGCPNGLRTWTRRLRRCSITDVTQHGPFGVPDELHSDKVAGQLQSQGNQS